MEFYAYNMVIFTLDFPRKNSKNVNKIYIKYHYSKHIFRNYPPNILMIGTNLNLIQPTKGIVSEEVCF